MADIDLPNINDRPNIFADLDSIAITDAEDGVAEERFTSTVGGFGKPNNQSFVRCHPDPERVMRVFGIKSKGDRGKIFVVPKPMLPKLGLFCQRFILRQAITSLGMSFIWPGAVAQRATGRPDDQAAPGDTAPSLDQLDSYVVGRGQ